MGFFVFIAVILNRKWQNLPLFWSVFFITEPRANVFRWPSPSEEEVAYDEQLDFMAKTGAEVPIPF